MARSGWTKIFLGGVLGFGGCRGSSPSTVAGNDTGEGTSAPETTGGMQKGEGTSGPGDLTSGSGPGSTSAGSEAGDSQGTGDPTTGPMSDPGPAPPAPDPTAVPGVRFVGRIDGRDPDGIRFAWSGAGFVAMFEGTAASVDLRDSGQNMFTVVVDGEVRPPLIGMRGDVTYELATGLPAGEHLVEVYRRTEPSFGVTAFLGFTTDGTPLTPPAASRRIEIIGDSISAGYGNLGDSPACSFSADTQDHYQTYGAISAREVGAELHTIAWSGKGVVYNYDTDTVLPMPALYDRVLPGDQASRWDFSIVPDVVVINLGTNDFSTDGDPTPELFEGEYLALLRRIRENYPQARILCTVGNLLSGADLVAAQSGIANAVAAFEAAGGDNAATFDINVPNTAPGCDYHPSLEAHRAMADLLTAELRIAFGAP